MLNHAQPVFNILPEGSGEYYEGAEGRIAFLSTIGEAPSTFNVIELRL